MPRNESQTTAPPERTARLTISIPARLRRELRAAATADTRTVSNLVTLFILEGLAARAAVPFARSRPTRNALQEVE